MSPRLLLPHSLGSSVCSPFPLSCVQNLHTSQTSDITLWSPGLSSSAPSYRYQLQSQEDTKERRHSHTIGGLPEADDQSELPSPPALSMSLSAKGQLTNIGQCFRSLTVAWDEAGVTLQCEARQLDFRVRLVFNSHRTGWLRGASVYPSKIRLKAKCSKILKLKSCPWAQAVRVLVASESLNHGVEKPQTEARRSN